MDASELERLPEEAAEYKSIFRSALQVRQQHEALFNLNKEVMIMMSIELVKQYNDFVDKYVDYYKNCIYYLAKFEGFYTALPGLMTSLGKTCDFMLKLQSVGTHLQNMPNLMHYLNNLQQSGSVLRLAMLELAAKVNFDPAALRDALAPMLEELDLVKSQLRVLNEQLITEQASLKLVANNLKNRQDRITFSQSQLAASEKRLQNAQQNLEKALQARSGTSITIYKGFLSVESARNKELEINKWRNEVDRLQNEAIKWRQEIDSPCNISEEGIKYRISTLKTEILEKEQTVRSIQAQINDKKSLLYSTVFSKVGCSTTATEKLAKVCCGIDEIVLKMATITGQVEGARDTILEAIKQNRMFPELCLSTFSCALKIPIIYNILDTGYCDTIHTPHFITNVRNFDRLRYKMIEKKTEGEQIVAKAEQAKIVELSFDDVNFDFN